MSAGQQAHRLSEQYASKPANYYSGARRDFVEMLPVNASAQILEVGCGQGLTGALAIEQGRCGRYVGVEVMQGPAAKAGKHLSEVIVGNIEEIELPFSSGTFDALILSEILEHLVDPWAVLKKLGSVLRPGAQVLSSSPNIAYWKVFRDLYRGQFDYAERGIMDRTHLRWFTPETYRDLFQSCGYSVDRVFPIAPLKPHQSAIAALLGGRQNLFVSQICLSGHWTGGKA